MTYKETLLKEVYRLENMIAEIEGTEQKDVEQLIKTGAFAAEAKKQTEAHLGLSIAFLHEQYRKAVEKKNYKERSNSHIITPEKAAQIATLQNECDAIWQEWHKYRLSLIAAFDTHIQQTLGIHWGICYFDRNSLRIGVIDAENSTPEQRKYFIEQIITIKLEEKIWGTEQEAFNIKMETGNNCFNAEGQVVGDRAFFYIGIGQLLANQELVNYLRTTMRDAKRKYNNVFEKVYNLKLEMQNLTKE